MGRAQKRKPTDQARRIDGLLAGPSAAPAAAAPRRHFTPDEHIAWCEANLYRDVKDLGWAPLRYAAWQKDLIRKLYAVTPEGSLVYKTIVPCLPRRCGKSEITGAYDLHRAQAYDDQKIVIQANSADQGEATVFGEICKTIQNSPALKAKLDAKDIEVLAGEILFHRTGSAIKVQPAAERSTYGQKIHDYHNTELCRAVDDSCFQTGASSTGDAWSGLSQMDSNMGDRGNPVARYVDLADQAEAEAAKAAGEGRPANPEVGDPSIGAVWIRFADLADCLKRGCGEGLAAGEEAIHPWLDPAWIRGRCKQMTRGEFLRNHCNLPTGAGEVLWTEEQISPLFRRIPKCIPPDKFSAAVGAFDGRMAVGVGLDRAGAFSKDPDRTSLAAVGRIVLPGLAGQPMPVFGPKGETIETEVTDGSVYVLLGLWTFAHALRDPLQAKLLEIDSTWGIGHVCLEAYQASDLAEWCRRQRFGDRSDLVHMTAQAKQQLVHFMHGLVVMRRFWASQEHAVLRAEFLNYREDASGAIPSFYGPRTAMDLDVPQADGSVVREATWIKDDELESVLWATHAARQAKGVGRARMVAKPQGL